MSIAPDGDAENETHLHMWKKSSHQLNKAFLRIATVMHKRYLWADTRFYHSLSAGGEGAWQSVIHVQDAS